MKWSQKKIIKHSEKANHISSAVVSDKRKRQKNQCIGACYVKGLTILKYILSLGRVKVKILFI